MMTAMATADGQVRTVVEEELGRKFRYFEVECLGNKKQGKQRGREVGDEEAMADGEGEAA